MTFKNCITDGVTEGAISQDQANEVLGLFDELETQYNRQMGGAAASAKAAGDTTIAMKKMAIERKRRVALQAQTWKGISNDLANYRNGLGENDKGAAALSLSTLSHRLFQHPDMPELLPTIGLEIHAELKTSSKISRKQR